MPFLTKEKGTVCSWLVIALQKTLETALRAMWSTFGGVSQMGRKEGLQLVGDSLAEEISEDCR